MTINNQQLHDLTMLYLKDFHADSPESLAKNYIETMNRLNEVFREYKESYAKEHPIHVPTDERPHVIRNHNL